MAITTWQTPEANATVPSPFVDGDEIQQKVLTMLAATEALKPTVESPDSKLSPKKNYGGVRSSIRSRVSEAWDRFLLKRGATTRSSSQVKREKYATDDLNESLSKKPIISGPLELQSLPNVEIRMNEGHNLGRGKVQRIVGGSIARKPVPTANNQAQNRMSGDYDADSSDQGYHIRGCSVSLYEYDANSVASADPEHGMPHDPFESESRFESYLEDGVLSSLPTGASTPRMQVTGSSSDEPMIPAGSPASGGLQLNITGVSLDDDQIFDFEDEWSLQEQQKIQMEHIRQRVLREGESVKKHPSPSKLTLEILSKAMDFSQRHGGLIDVEQDELADNFGTCQRLLAPRNDRRPLNTDLSERCEDVRTPQLG